MGTCEVLFIHIDVTIGGIIMQVLFCHIVEI